MAKRWFPGHYFYVLDGPNYGKFGMAEYSRDLVKSNANFTGYLLGYWWYNLEPSKGVYDFSAVLSDLAKCAADGKKAIIRLNDRSFWGWSRGYPVPQYIETEYNAVWASQTNGENIVAYDQHRPEVAERWLLCMEALIAATRDNPVLQGYQTEECSIAGIWDRPDWTWQKQNAFILEQARRGSRAAGDTIFFQNMGWSNEPGNDTVEHYRMTDTVVRQYGCGIGPTDMTISGSMANLNTTYGSYMYNRYKGEAAFISGAEWSAFDRPELPTQLLNFAVDTLQQHFVMWSDRRPKSVYGGYFDSNDIVTAVNAQSGRAYTTKPSTIANPPGTVPGTGDTPPNVPDTPTTTPPAIPVVTIPQWDAKLTSSANTWTTRGSSGTAPTKTRRPRRAKMT